MFSRRVILLATATQLVWFAGPVLAQDGTEQVSLVQALNQAAVQVYSQLRTTSPGQAGNLHRQAVPILEKRAAALAALIERDPARAASLTLSPDILSRLKAAFPESASQIESQGTWEGPVEQLIIDDQATQQSRSVTLMDLGVEKLAIHFTTSGRPAISNGTMLRVTGIRALSHVAASSGVILPNFSTATSAAMCSTTGPQNTAVILVTFPGVSPPNISPASVHDMFFGSTGRSINGFLQESSGGQTSATGNVFGWYTLDSSYSCDQYAQLRDAAIRAADADVNFLNYTRVAIVFPDPGSCNWSGMGSLGCGSVTSADGTFNASTAWGLASYLTTTDQAVGLFAHEFGHNLGLQHGRSRDFKPDALGPLGATGTLFEYGDQFSVMGSSSLGLYSADHRATLGWMANGTNYQTVQSNGTFTLQPLETNPPGLQALQIQRGTGNNSWLWVEYRQPLGNYDTSLSSQVYSGALIHYKDALTGNLYSDLLDYTPGTVSWGDPALTAGKTWVDPYSNVSLSIVNATPTALTLSVNYGAATCNALNPSVTLTPSGQSVAAGSTATYTVTVTNNNSTVCSASNFSLSAAVPSGWTAGLASPSLSIAPGASASTTANVTPPAGTATSTYIVSLTATSGSYSGVGTGSVTVTSTGPSGCTSANPSLTLSPSTQSVPVGGRASYTVNLVNNNSSGCPATTFSVSAGVPAGWTSSLGATSFTLNSGIAGSTSLTTTPPTGTAAGTYAVSATAASGAYSATVSGFLTLTAICTTANPIVTLNPPSPGTVAGGTAGYTVTVTNMDSAACSASSFGLASSAPSGWPDSFSSTSVTVSPGQSASVTLTKSVPAGTVPGTYSVNATASRGTNSASGGASCIVSAPLTASIDLPGGGTYPVRSTVSIEVTVKTGTAPMSGVNVTFALTRSNGGLVTASATTNSSGVATWSYKVSQKGTYSASATAAYGGQSASTGSATFVAK